MECFITSSKDIEGRIDSNYYKLEHRKLNKQLIRVEHKPLGELVNFSNETWNQLNMYEMNFPYIEISNIDVPDGDIENIKYYETVVAPSRARMIVRKDDIIVSTTRPHRGAIALIDKEKDGFIASTGFAILRELQTELITKEYLFHVLRMPICLNQMFQRTTGGNYPAITIEELARVIIPIVNPIKQKEIIGIMQSAYQVKKQKEAEAQELLDSIDNYVLSELGINIDYEPKLTFIAYSNQVKNRLDPGFHYQDVYYFLSDYQGNTTNTGDCIEYAQSGFAAGYKDQDASGKGILQIRPTNISDNRHLVFDKNIYVHQETIEKQPDDLLVKGEVLFNNTNSQELVGKSVVFDLNGQYFCSNHITRIRANNEKLTADYLTAILNLYQRRGVFYRICTNWNNQSGVNVESLKTVKIPLPSIDIQRKISSEIIFRMYQAEELRRQAKAEIEKAKAEVERLMLGG